MLAYAFDNEPVEIVDLEAGEKLPKRVTDAFHNPAIKKFAHNASFERVALRRMGYDIPVEQWRCTMVMSAYCGLPLSLGKSAAALQLDQQKDTSGVFLIRHFCTPNKDGDFNRPEDSPEKWEQFKNYCVQDVYVERRIHQKLNRYAPPATEWQLYALDQKINDTGIKIDLEFTEKCRTLYARYSAKLKEELNELTGLENANSLDQLKGWLTEQLGKEVKSLTAKDVSRMLKEVGPGAVRTVLKGRQNLSKSSVKKYPAMARAASNKDHRGRGLVQFYGANRTGRWAGRLVQVHNLPRNSIEGLAEARQTVLEGDTELIELLYGDLPDLLSQLIRTSLVAPEGKMLCVADFSAIEARVIAWLANEKWRLDIFKSHGKIYEASASKMFGVPIEQIGKGSDLRQRGKVAELALGYGGGVGALKQMGAAAMGLTTPEMEIIKTAWRNASPHIVAMWRILEKAAIAAVMGKRKIILKKYKGLVFECDSRFLSIQLPSGRKLHYAEPELFSNRFDRTAVKYKGTQGKSGWGWVETYGGKLAENIVQAIARDALAETMLRLDRQGFKLNMHVHDEAMAEVDTEIAQKELARMCTIMGQPIEWAKGLPLNSDGYITPFYKKD